MAINVSCPECRTAYRVADDYAGKQVWCPTCHQMLPVPSVAEPVDVVDAEPVPNDLGHVTATAPRTSAPSDAAATVRPAGDERAAGPRRPRSTGALAGLVAGGVLLVVTAVCCAGVGGWLPRGRVARPVELAVAPEHIPENAVAPPALPPPKARPKPDFDLTGTWFQAGSTLSVRQIDHEVWWVMKSPDNGRGFTHAFHGQLDGDTLTGQFADVPAGGNREYGRMTLRVIRRDGQAVGLQGEVVYAPGNHRIPWSVIRARGKQ